MVAPLAYQTRRVSSRLLFLVVVLHLYSKETPFGKGEDDQLTGVKLGAECALEEIEVRDKKGGGTSKNWVVLRSLAITNQYGSGPGLSTIQ